MSGNPSTRLRLKQLIVSSLNLEGVEPESIGDETPLIGQGLGIDSVDALELVVHIEREFGVRILGHDLDQNVFASVATLAEYLDRRRATAAPA